MPHPKAPWHYLLLLVLAGESVFILPFVLPRVFRPTVLDTFAVDNTQLGWCFSAYGFVALAAYLFGGPLADRLPPRRLMAVGLWSTALGGLLLATFPGYGALRALYAYWGFTTIGLFWAPMIKATRLWGGAGRQGRAFGLLDGGRGLVGALFGALGIWVFGAFLAAAPGAETLAESRVALRQVILVSTGLIAVVGALVWRFLRAPGAAAEGELRQRITRAQVGLVLRLPAVRLLMVIILCAYTGYKVTDVFSLYARQVLGYDQLAAARVGSALLFARPVVGLAIGLLADRTRITALLLASFGLAAAGAALFAAGVVTATAAGLFIFSTGLVALGVYAARALYFAVMAAGRIPLALTGTAVGLISLIGYTPDIFSGPLLGYFLDGWPGLAGQRAVFALVVAFSLVGGAAAWRYDYLFGRGRGSKNL